MKEQNDFSVNSKLTLLIVLWIIDKIINKIILSLSITWLRALIENFLPTKSGATICGKTTISLNGKTGIFINFISTKMSLKEKKSRLIY